MVEQGEAGDELYLLLDGVLAVEVDGDEVAEIGPGQSWANALCSRGVGGWPLCRHGRAAAWGLFRPMRSIARRSRSSPPGAGPKAEPGRRHGEAAVGRGESRVIGLR